MLSDNISISKNEDFYAEVAHGMTSFEFYKTYRMIQDDPAGRFTGFFENDINLSKLAASQADSYEEAKQILTASIYYNIDDEYLPPESVRDEVDIILKNIINNANSGHLVLTNKTAENYFNKQIAQFPNHPSSQNDWLTTMLAARMKGTRIDGILSQVSNSDCEDIDFEPSFISKYVLRLERDITAVEEMYEKSVDYTEKLNELRALSMGQTHPKSENISQETQQLQAVINKSLEAYLEFDKPYNHYVFEGQKHVQYDWMQAQLNEAWFGVHTNLRALNNLIDHMPDIDAQDLLSAKEYINSVRKILGEHSILHVELQPVFKAQECLKDTKTLISELSAFEGAISSLEIAQELGQETKTLLSLREQVLEKKDIFNHISNELEHYGHEYSINNQLQSDVRNLHAHATVLCSHVIYDENKKPVPEQSIRQGYEPPVKINIKLK